DGFLDQSGAKASRTNLDSPGSTIDERPHSLQIWVKDSLGLVVGVADSMARQTPLAAHVARVCHWSLLPRSLRSLSENGAYATIGPHCLTTLSRMLKKALQLRSLHPLHGARQWVPVGLLTYRVPVAPPLQRVNAKGSALPAALL